MVRTAAVLAVFLLARTPDSAAQLSPGELHKAHASLEGVENCTRCHDRDRKQVSAKCLECHVMVAQSLNNMTGLHGRQKYSACELCHVEHHDRDYELLYWPQTEQSFDHNLTGYPLQGGHARLECRRCHRAANLPAIASLAEPKKDPDRTYMGLSVVCKSCHFDEHRGQFTAPCEQCHTTERWTAAPGFDHNKTKYPLLGKHQQVPCAKCHRVISDPVTMRDTSYVEFANLRFDNCTACHKDVHQEKLGRDCAKCHTADGWNTVNQKQFDHQRTRYPLEGRHATVRCEKCHTPGRPHTGLAFKHCEDCHKDHHEGEFAKQRANRDCDECHSLNGFLPSFYSLAKHDSTRYPLRGAHGAIACLSCHPSAKVSPPLGQARFLFDSFRCAACHRDPHGEAIRQLADSTRTQGCELCHIDNDWKTMVFNHERTAFGLTGKHANGSCRGCHHGADTTATPAVFVFHGTPGDCAACHTDIHQGQLAEASPAEGVKPTTKCDRCHSTQNWKAERFVHDLHSQFRLEGGHRRVPCAGCHPKTIAAGVSVTKFKPIATACKACHGAKYTQEALTG